MTQRDRLEQMAHSARQEAVSLKVSTLWWAPKRMAEWNAQADAVKWALSEIDRLTAELGDKLFRPIGDNHHNAERCPFCSPNRAEVIAAAEARGEQRGREAQCGSCETCAQRWVSSAGSESYCQQTRVVTYSGQMTAFAACARLGNGCRAWQARAEKGE